MKACKYISDSKSHAEMKFFKDVNSQSSLRNKNENRFCELLETKTNLKFSRQAIWGRRIFDVWVDRLGLAFEIDGNEHVERIDKYRDEWIFRRSGIVVIRVKNPLVDRFFENLPNFETIGTWKSRRERLNKFKSYKRLIKFKYDPKKRLLDSFLKIRLRA